MILFLAWLVKIRSKYFKSSCRPPTEQGLWPSGTVPVVMKLWLNQPFTDFLFLFWALHPFKTPCSSDLKFAHRLRFSWLPISESPRQCSTGTLGNSTSGCNTVLKPPESGLHLQSKQTLLTHLEML